MKPKPKLMTIKLAGPTGWDKNDYKIIEVRNTIAYAPGTWIRKAEVVSLITDEDTEVIIVEFKLEEPPADESLP